MKPLQILLLLSSLIASGLLRAEDAKVLEVEHIVQTAAGQAAEWTPATVDQLLAIRDRIRTRQRSRATVKLTSLYTMRLEQLTTIEISPQLMDDDKPKLDLAGGALFIFSREQAGEIDIKTPAANGALRGTQLFVSVDQAGGRTFFQALEGSVEVSNAQGKVLIARGEAAEAVPGSAPKRTAVIEAKNILQWALYYPAVIDPAELEGDAPSSLEHSVESPKAGLPPPADTSLAAYAQGDLLRAVELLPHSRVGGEPGRCLQAAILLAVGRVDEAQRFLRGVSKENGKRRALERLIAAVKFEEQPDWQVDSLTSSSEALAESYYQQSRSHLEQALNAAKRATELSPANGHAWVRLAELEFSFGHTRAARTALDRGLELAPRHAQAHALLGFVLSAENEIGKAGEEFELAVRLDGALGNGWLGLGLTKIKRGDVAGGRQDLQTAATVVPLMAIFHSYLGKVFSVEGRRPDARKDLDLARQLDPQDPTPWLYSAIDNQQHNETNRAIEEMQESMRLNDNRRVYRSEFLLDQDRAVRSSNLATMYQNNGMGAVAVWEAARAVQSDYTNASAHLFLANAFHALRDPKRISLRYETPWFNELLLSNLLAPVGGGPLSQYVSQMEYSKLLEADGIGASIAHEWRDTDEVRASASVFGTSGNVSFGIDYAWRDDPGTRINNKSSLDEVYAQTKWQASPDDTLYFLGKWAGEKHGDIFDTYDNKPLEPEVFFREDQEPGLLLAGWNHRWAPGSHTLFLAGRLSCEQQLTNPRTNQLLLSRDDAAMRPGFIHTVGWFDQFTNLALAGSVTTPDFERLVYSQALLNAIAPYIGTGEVLGVGSEPFQFDTWRKFEIYTSELQHIQQMDELTMLGGVRFQTGEFDTTARMSILRPTFSGGFSTPAVDQSTSVDFERLSVYDYNFWSLAPWLTMIGGVAWDHIEHPDNFRNPPMDDRQREDERLSGKAGLILTPSPSIQLRGAFTQGLGGVTYDESVRLEPVQIAGFNQSYRTVISESLAGSVETPQFQGWGVSLDGRLPTKTWWGVSGNVIEQDVDRTLGAFMGYSPGVFPITPAYFPGSTKQTLAYREESAMATINQLLGEEWALGTSYRVTQSELRTTFPDIPLTLMPGADLKDRAVLHELGLSLNWNSPTGLFARVEGNWFVQDLEDDPRGVNPSDPPRTGDDFWQANAFAGYRFNRNLCEVSAGLLNIGNQDYQLSPLNPFFDIARDRTFVVRCRFSF